MAVIDDWDRTREMAESDTCPHCGGRGFIPPVKVCANENCRREFRWVDDEPGKNRRTVGVMFCSHRCAAAQKQREYRRVQRVLRGAVEFFGCTEDEVRRGLSGEDAKASRGLGLYGSDRDALLAQLEMVVAP